VLGNELQIFGYVFAHALSAVPHAGHPQAGACSWGRAWQVIGQRPACRLVFGRCVIGLGRRRGRSSPGADWLRALDDQFELRDPLVVTLGFAPELDALVARDLQLELLDQQPCLDDLEALGLARITLDDQSLQRFNVVRKCSIAVRMSANFIWRTSLVSRTLMLCASHISTLTSSAATSAPSPPIDAREQHRQLRTGQVTAPELACGQTNLPCSSRLANKTQSLSVPPQEP